MLSAAAQIVQREEAAGRSWRTAIPVIVQELGVSPLCACRLAAGLTADAVLGLLGEWELGPPSLEAWELVLTVPSPLAAFALGLIYRVPPDLLGVPAGHWHDWRSQRRAGQHPRS
jgi:hypothetical protein